MVSGIIGNYLVEKGVLTAEQLNSATEEQHKTRVKLGLIAVAEGLMTTEEADIVNMLQTAMDKRFGDIAVEKGYLTEGQVEALLKKQGNAYLAFAQALENMGLMTFEELEQHLADFQQENQFTASDIEDLKSDDADRIIKVFLDNSCQQYMELVGTAFRTLMRCVDTEIYPSRAYLTDFCAANTCAMQHVEGNPGFTTALLGMDDALLPVATIFGNEEFPEVNDDALDAVAELINCINGLYATSLSYTGEETDLLPPEFSHEIMALTGKEFLVLPIYIKGKRVDFAVSIENKVEMQ
ncbi:MAG: hypothetical protein IJ833_11300 [Lachnospiraceae bacterium]|nr:hypothetical protein [Lachnospiraceae bacterium]